MNPHHINEIAQSETAFGKKPWVKYWLHNDFLNLKLKEKMSKSTGQIVRLETLEEKGYSPMDFRYLCLLTHYRKIIEFDLKNLDAAKNSLKRLKNILSELKNGSGKTNKRNLEMAKKQFTEFVNDDLNTPRALSYLWEILREDRLNNSEKYRLALEFDKVFGLGLDKEDKIKIPADVKKLVKERENCRRKKDWAQADNLRKKIKQKGFSVEDVGEGSKVRLV
jgi:cysteinyl-tRNA synthetase